MEHILVLAFSSCFPKLLVNMISVKYSAIPCFLHGGSLYETFEQDEEDEEIIIPADCFAAEDRVNDSHDCVRMLEVTSFWGLYRIPLSLVEYCSVNDLSLWSDIVGQKCSEIYCAQVLLRVFAKPTCGEYICWDKVPLGRAIKAGIDEIVQFLAGKLEDSTEPAVCAAVNGRLDYFQLLHQHGHPWDSRACEMAAREGHLDCLMFLHEHGCPLSGFLPLLHYYAAGNGHLDCMKYAFEQGLQWPDQSNTIWHTSISARIVEGNCIEMLHYAIERGLELTEGALVKAITTGKINFVETLLEAGCDINKSTAWHACDVGRLDILQLLVEWGAEWDASATQVTAEKGYLDILVYLHENECPWNAKTTRSAVQAGQLSTLRSLIENDCPYREDILYDTVQCVTEGGMQCLRYLYEEWLLPEESHYVTLWVAFGVGNHQALQYLLDLEWSYDQEDIVFDDALQTEVCGYMKNKNIVDYDANLLKCIQCATNHGWEMVAPGSEFSVFVCGNEVCLPLCASFYQSELTL